jgi:transketolase
VQSVDGHDQEAIAAAIGNARKTDRPSLIACRSVIGFGAPNKAGTADTHGAPLGDDEIAASREQLDWPHAPFDIPGPIREQWAAAGHRSLADYEAWQERLASAGDLDEFLRMTAGELPEGWLEQLVSLKQTFAEEAPTLATRKASGQVLSVLTAAVPEMIGGSADLTGSVNTRTEQTIPISADDFTGRYVHYGVREHAMAAVMNGVALHGGFVPYGGTFLVFADYMRAAMRLSSLMGQRVVYVLTHDSIGLGEDGPTHQPVETLATLRALPNFNVYRPADAVETAECWALALQDGTGPSGIVLSRQGLPTLRRKHVPDNVCARGAYVLAEAEGDRQVTLLATGSEATVALAARDKLQDEGVGAAVVSMPCWELFDEQDDDYQDSVLGPGTVRVAVEAAVRLGWDRYLGAHGRFVGMSGFGASAPAADLYEHFGITAAAVADAARAGLHERTS